MLMPEEFLYKGSLAPLEELRKVFRFLTMIKSTLDLMLLFAS